MINRKFSIASNIDRYQRSPIVGKETDSGNWWNRIYDEFIRESLLFRKEDTDAGNAPKGRDKVTKEGRRTSDV